MIGIQRQRLGKTGQRFIKALGALQLAAFGHDHGNIHVPLHTRWLREAKPEDQPLGLRRAKPA